ELTWAAFIAEVRKPFTPYQKFIIRCCTSAPQLMILPGKHCPTITYLPKPPRRPDYCNNVEDIKEYLLMEAKYDSRSLHDPSKTINWTHPPEGPDCTWETLSNLVPPSIVGSNQASIVPSAMPLTTGKLNHHSQGAHQKPHQTPPDHTMEEFLHLSHIHPDNTRTRALFTRRELRILTVSHRQLPEPIDAVCQVHQKKSPTHRDNAAEIVIQTLRRTPFLFSSKQKITIVILFQKMIKI
ncbi:hypothetical protein PCASD_20346, partial [Puccinia coronata f. sp. avenae]